MIWDVGGLLPVTGDKLIEQLVQQGLTFAGSCIRYKSRIDYS